MAQQGDAADLGELVGTGLADVVLCHRVLEVVDSVPLALAGMATVLRRSGQLNLLVPQRSATVLAQAVAGNVAQARSTYAADEFEHERALDLLPAAGFEIRELHGIGAVADHVPGAALPDGHAYDELLLLERAISDDSGFRALAPQLQVLAIRR